MITKFWLRSAPLFTQDPPAAHQTTMVKAWKMISGPWLKEDLLFIVKRGDFSKVEKSIEAFKKRGITTLYMMGVLDRDNNPYFNKSEGEI